MTRVPDLAPEALNDIQKRLAADIAGSRGGVVRGPFAIWLRQPSVAEAANRLGNVLRLEGKLNRKLFELAILLVARSWNAQYEWYAHENAALAAGLAPELVEAIRVGRALPSLDATQQAVVDLVNEINATRTVSTPVYHRAIEQLGLDLVIELVSATGFYTMVAMMLNAFDCPVPGGVRPLVNLTRADHA